MDLKRGSFVNDRNSGQDRHCDNLTGVNVHVTARDRRLMSDRETEGYGGKREQ